MKKILYVSTCYPSEALPQQCIFLEQQAQALISLNNKVDILVPVNSESKNVIFNGIEVFHIKYRNSVIDKIKYFIDKDFQDSLVELLIHNVYDIVSIHLCPDKLARIIIKTCKKMNIPIVVHYHGLNVWKNYYQKYPFYESYQAMRRKIIISDADAIVGVSNKVCEIVKSKIKNVPCFTVYNGVDCSIFKPKKNKNNGCFCIVCIANLIAIKGQKYLIDAFSKIIKTYPHNNFSLEIVGGGADFTILKSIVDNLGLTNHVNFHGYVNYEEVVTVLRKADIFIMPSFFEALGCVYLEAMACKVPVIGCKDQGIEEIIQNEINGICVSPQNSIEIEESIRLLFENEGLRSYIAENGYQTVKNNFTWVCSAQNLIEVYDRLIHRV
jgi:glycosyltransferase involved in cell wall biosynthesis